MSERSGPDGQANGENEEDLSDVHDRLSEFVNEEDEPREERADEPETTEPETDTTSRAAGESEAETGASDLIVKTAIRERVEEMAVANDFYEALNEAVEGILDDAARRAEANGRKTVQVRDL